MNMDEMREFMCFSPTSLYYIDCYSVTTPTEQPQQPVQLLPDEYDQMHTPHVDDPYSAHHQQTREQQWAQQQQMDPRQPQHQQHEHIVDECNTMVEGTELNSASRKRQLPVNGGQHVAPSYSRGRGNSGKVVKKRSKKVKDENYVKRPMNSFFVWSHKRRLEIQAENPSVHNTEISKWLGEEWKAMSDEAKKPYEAEFRRLSIERMNKMSLKNRVPVQGVNSTQLGLPHLLGPNNVFSNTPVDWRSVTNRAMQYGSLPPPT